MYTGLDMALARIAMCCVSHSPPLSPSLLFRHECDVIVLECGAFKQNTFARNATVVFLFGAHKAATVIRV